MNRSEHKTLGEVVALLTISHQRQAVAITELQRILEHVERELAKEDAAHTSQANLEVKSDGDGPL